MPKHLAWFIGSCQHFHDLKRSISMSQQCRQHHQQQNFNCVPATDVAVLDHVINSVNLSTCRQMQLPTFTHFDRPRPFEQGPTSFLLMRAQAASVDGVDMGCFACACGPE